MNEFKSDNAYSTTRSSSLRLARRAGLRAHVARIKWQRAREASRRCEAKRQRRGGVAGTNLKMTTSQPIVSARHAQKIAILCNAFKD